MHCVKGLFVLVDLLKCPKCPRLFRQWALWVSKKLFCLLVRTFWLDQSNGWVDLSRQICFRECLCCGDDTMLGRVLKKEGCSINCSTQFMVYDHLLSWTRYSPSKRLWSIWEQKFVRWRVSTSPRFAFGFQIQIDRCSESDALVLKVDAARDALAGMILSHIPVINYNFQPKCIYICVMIRRIFFALKDRYNNCYNNFMSCSPWTGLVILQESIRWQGLLWK